MVGLYAPDNSSSFLSRSKILINVISDYAVQPSIAHDISLGTWLKVLSPCVPTLSARAIILGTSFGNSSLFALSDCPLSSFAIALRSGCGSQFHIY
jgi:hypothetical protein